MPSTNAQRGSHTKSWTVLRESVIQRDDEECSFCGTTREQHREKSPHNRDLEVHHIIPRREDGRDIPQNLITVCRDCHESLETITRTLLSGVPAADLALDQNTRSASPEQQAHRDTMKFYSGWYASQARREGVTKLAREHQHLRNVVENLLSVLEEQNINLQYTPTKDTTPTEELLSDHPARHRISQ